MYKLDKHQNLTSLDPNHPSALKLPGGHQCKGNVILKIVNMLSYISTPADYLMPASQGISIDMSEDTMA